MATSHVLPAAAILMLAYVVAIPASGSAQPSVTRTYYIAADELEWDYAPGMTNRINGGPIEGFAARTLARGPNRIGSIYLKALYREYTDETFSRLKERPAEWEHLGFLGPLLRGVVGDTIVVVFRNNTSFPASLHPHGVFYMKDSEGSPYEDGTAGSDKADDGVPPGGTHTYVWPVPERAGPVPGGPSSAFWMYHSHVHEVAEVNAGLVGPMIITARGAARADGTPSDVDRELIVAFAEVNENASNYLDENIRRFTDASPEALRDSTFFAFPFGGSNFMETMNGFVWGHLPGLTMRVGERVRWYLMASTNFEFHTPHWHGNTVAIGLTRTDMAGLLPMDMKVADMVPDNPGTWLFHCHVADHLEAGMQSLYTVLPAEVVEATGQEGH